MKKFTVSGKQYQAEDCVGGVLVNPKLPARFDLTPNDARPASHQKFWGLPYIVADTVQEMDAFYLNRTDEYANAERAMWSEHGRDVFLKAFPSGSRYDVHCLDGGAWDRPTWWGCFATLDKALECAVAGPEWRCQRN